MLKAYTEQEVLELLIKEYGFPKQKQQIKIKQLGGYTDRNYLITIHQNKARYILKISSSKEDYEMLKFQNIMLKHVTKTKRQSLKDIQFPQLVSTLKEEDMVIISELESKQQNYLRLFVYIEGEELYDVKAPSHQIFTEIGSTVAHLSLEFKQLLESDVEIQQLCQQVNWKKYPFNIDHFENLYSQKIQFIFDQQIRNIVHTVYTKYQEFVKPILNKIEKNVTHNDICFTNILIKDAEKDKQDKQTSIQKSQKDQKQSQRSMKISGLIDFSSAIYTYEIMQLVICCARMSLIEQAPLKNILDIMQAYNKIKPITKEQLSIFYNLIQVRLCSLVLISSELAKLNSHDEYFLKCSNGHYKYLRIIGQACTNQQFIQMFEQGKTNADFSEQYDFQILPELTEEEQKQIQQEHLASLNKFYQETSAYKIENWYEELKQFTFRSSSFELTAIEAYLLQLLYYEENQILSQEKYQIISKNLNQKVNLFIQQYFQANGCFMKLSTRSPKDSSWNHKCQNQQEIQIKAQEVISFLKLKYEGEIMKIDRKFMNLTYLYFLSVSKPKLKISKAEDFIRLFSKSERIIIDLSDFDHMKGNLFAKFKENDFDRQNQHFINIWGREWYECEWMEQFRGFFNGEKLTAISQYDQRCYFEDIQGKENIVEKHVIELFNAMKPKLEDLKMKQGVMDVVVKIPQQKDQLGGKLETILIEINVFNENTRSSLFSWKQQRQILQHGPLEVRFLKEYKEISKLQIFKMMGMIGKGIEELMDRVCEKLGLSQEWEQSS